MAKLKDLVITSRSDSDSTESHSSVSIEELRISKGASEIVRIFTDDAEQISTHYRETEAYRGYVKCLGGDDCPLCLAGLPPCPKIVLFVYSVKQNAVMSLTFSPNTDPHALCPQLLDIIDSSGENSVFVKINRINMYRWSVDIVKPSNSAIGTDIISRFTAKFPSTEQAVASVFKSMTAEEMKADDDIRRILETQGLI